MSRPDSGGEAVRILHVDDHPRAGEAAGRRLAAENDAFEVVAETAVAAALERLDGGGFDCVVSGYDMAVDGLDFLEAVRERFPGLPFILYTNEGSEAVAGEAIRRGVTDYLPKGTGADRVALLADRVETAVAGRRSERELEAARQRFRTLVEESTDAILVVDGTGEITYATRAVEGVLGREPATLVGTSGFDLLHPEDVDRVAATLDELLAAPDGRASVDARYEHGDGGYIWLEIRGRDLRGDSTVGGVVTYVRDITDRKERERELERQNERLDAFASVVSHDLRNPLSVAEGRLELAREERDGEHLAALDAALADMGSLIDDLLELARQGRTVDVVGPVALGDLVAGCWTGIGGSGDDLAVEGDAVVLADRNRLRRLLENLLRNAVEHGGRGRDGAAVRVGTLPDGFFVGDDGPGVPPAERERVFDAGYSPGDAGTGLSLKIVADIAGAHGWSVAATDGADGGARFEVTGVATEEG